MTNNLRFLHGTATCTSFQIATAKSSNVLSSIWTRSCGLDTGREGVIARENVTSRVLAPPVLCSKAKVAKVGGIVVEHYSILVSWRFFEKLPVFAL